MTAPGRLTPALAVALVTAAVVIELTVLARLPLPGATPDLVLLVVVALAIAHGPAVGTVVGFGAGLVLDLAPPADHAAGRWALVLCLVGHVAGLAADEARRSRLVAVVVCALAAAASTLLFAGAGVALGDPRVRWDVVVRLVPTSVVYALLLSPIVVPAVLALARRAARPRTDDLPLRRSR